MSGRFNLRRALAKGFSRKPWRLSLLLISAVTVATLGYCLFAPHVYEATVVVAFPAQGDPTDVGPAARFVAAITNPHTIERTAHSLGLSGNAREIVRTHRLRTILSDGVDDTLTIGVRVRASSAELADNWLPALTNEYLRAEALPSAETEILRPEVRVIAAAHRVGPNTNRIAASLFAAACIVMIASRLIVPRLLPHLTSCEQIESHCGVPCLGILPQVILRSAERHRANMSAATLLDELSCEGAFAPMARNDELGRVILVTSASPSEGKTFVSTLLARACASENLKTLLIDASSSNDLHHWFGLRPGPGRREYLADPATATLPTLCRQTWSPLLRVITSGIRNNPDNENAGTALREVLERIVPNMEAEYDRIIIDAPPVSDWHAACPAIERCAVALVVPSTGSFAPVTMRAVGMLVGKRPRYCACVLNGAALEPAWMPTPEGRLEHPYWQALATR